MKKALVSSIISIIVVTGVLFYLYRKHSIILIDPMKAVPTDAIFILEVTHPSKSTGEFFQSLKKAQVSSSWLDNIQVFIKKIEKIMTQDKDLLESWQERPIIISAHPISARRHDYLFLTDAPRGWTAKDLQKSIQQNLKIKFEVRRYESVEISELLNDTVHFAFALHKSVAMFAFNSILIEEAIRQLNYGKNLLQDDQFADVRIKSRTPSINFYQRYSGMLNMEFSNVGFQKMLKDVTKGLGAWSGFRLENERDVLLLTGKTAIRQNEVIASNVDYALLNKLIKTAPENLNFAGIAPASTAFMLEYAATDTIVQDIGVIVTQPASALLDNNIYLCYHLKKAIDIPSIRSQTYRTHTISYTNKVMDDFKNYNIDLLNKEKYFSTVGSYMVFTNEPAALKLLIDAYEDKKSLKEDSSYIMASASFRSECNARMFINPLRSHYLFSTVSEDNFFSTVGSASAIITQWKSNGKTFDTDLILDFRQHTNVAPQLICSTQLDTIVATQTIYSTNDNGYEEVFIVAQDQHNTLYTISESGDILWHKQIEGPILGAIKVIEPYKDGNKYLLFNTADKMYLLNGDGENGGNFPIRLPSIATAGLAIVATPSGYNIYVACINNYLYAYSSNGKPSTTWNYIQTDQPITGVHAFASPSRRLLVYTTELAMTIADERGNKVQSFSNIFRIDPTFGIELMGVDSNETFHWMARSMDSNCVEFTSSGQIFVTACNDVSPLTVSSQTDAVYKYDASGKIINGFPLKGGVAVIEQDHYLLTGTQDGLVNLYKLP